MKALRFYAPEDVRLEDQPEPECGSDEVKIRVRNCSTCGTDVKIFHNGHQNLTPPRTIGHEIAGEIVEVNEALVDNPGLVNEAAFDAWFFKLKVADTSVVDEFLDEAAYKALVE